MKFFSGSIIERYVNCRWHFILPVFCMRFLNFLRYYLISGMFISVNLTICLAWWFSRTSDFFTLDIRRYSFSQDVDFWKDLADNLADLLHNLLFQIAPNCNEPCDRLSLFCLRVYSLVKECVILNQNIAEFSYTLRLKK